jgi:predicted N-formylglutamate amidohydrolase
LVDLNRSPHNPRVFSSISRGLPLEERRELLARHHAPHWQRVCESIVQLQRKRRPVVHLGVHGFAPFLGGARRDFEVGLLYDPSRTSELVLARSWQKRLREFAPDLRVRRNAPYRGDADGLTTALRREFGPREYLGLELELNQRVLARAGQRRRLLSALSELLAAC